MLCVTEVVLALLGVKILATQNNSDDFRLLTTILFS